MGTLYLVLFLPPFPVSQFISWLLVHGFRLVLDFLILYSDLCLRGRGWCFGFYYWCMASSGRDAYRSYFGFCFDCSMSAKGAPGCTTKLWSGVLIASLKIIYAPIAFFLQGDEGWKWKWFLLEKSLKTCPYWRSALLHRFPVFRHLWSHLFTPLSVLTLP